MRTEILFSEETTDGIRFIPFEVDAVPEEIHHIEVQVTDQEVEEGVDVSDHARRKSAPLQLKVTVTAASLLGDREATPTTLSDAWAALEDAADRSLLAIVTTATKTYNDMLLISALSTKTAADGTWLRADLTFKPIRFVQTQLVADPVPARARDRRQVDRGTQSTSPAGDHLESIAHRAGREFFGFFD